MPTHSRQHSDATQIVEEILKEAAMPRQPASVKEAFEKKNPASIAPKMLGRHKAGKPKRLTTCRPRSVCAASLLLANRPRVFLIVHFFHVASIRSARSMSVCSCVWLSICNRTFSPSSCSSKIYCRQCDTISWGEDLLSIGAVACDKIAFHRRFSARWPSVERMSG